MDLIAANIKEEGGRQRVHGWENISLVSKEAAARTVLVE